MNISRQNNGINGDIDDSDIHVSPRYVFIWMYMNAKSKTRTKQKQKSAAQSHSAHGEPSIFWTEI